MLIDQIEADVKALAAEPFPTSDEDAVDLAGRVNKAAGVLYNLKRALLSEIPHAIQGDGYQLVETNKTTRSYNTAVLLRDFQKAGVTMDDLLAARALSLEWHWTETHREALKADIGLRIAGHELTPDGDEADHIGETRKRNLDLKPREF